MIGRVKTVQSARGFGFIRGDKTDIDFFFHAKDLDPSLMFSDALYGMAVEFNGSDGPRGPVAKDVRPVVGKGA